MTIEFHRDHEGIGEILRSRGVGAVVDGVADELETIVQGEIDADMPVITGTFTSDRRGATVTIAHPAGQAIQAKDGTLTRAASRLGLDVRSR